MTNTCIRAASRMVRAAMKLVMVVSLALLTGQPTMAHHSFAMYDRSTELNLEGVVREFQWTSPHAWIQVLVPDGFGGNKEWSVECGAPGMLARTGWNSHMLKAGDKVVLVVHPLRTGGPSASLVKVTLADGRILGPGGPPPPLPISAD
jgi:Family of unknown function (DUF6152)